MPTPPKKPTATDAERAAPAQEDAHGRGSHHDAHGHANDDDALGQAAFARAVLDPDAPTPAGLAPSDGGAPDKRFAVYRNNVVVSLIEALGAAYPTVKKLVGEQFFEAMAGAHVRAHPPTSPLMIFYGAAFPDWVADFPPAASLPYLSDIARLERARREAYHAADAAPLDAARFQAAVGGKPPEAVSRLRLTPHPAMRLVRSAHPIFSIWADVNGREMDVRPGGEDVLITRPRLDVSMRALPPGAFEFLTAVADGAPLAEAAIAGAGAAEAFDLSTNLAGVLESGAAASIDV